MALKGKSTKTNYPFIPVEERENTQNPTVFWIKPKNIEGLNEFLEKSDRAREPQRLGRQPIYNSKKQTEVDVKDFMEICNKVENYQFSIDYEDLAKRGIIREVTDKNDLRLLALDLDPIVFREVQNAVSSWDELSKGELAYETFKKLSEPKKDAKA